MASSAETLDAYYANDTFLAPRIWEEASRWFPNEPHMVEFITGHSLSCAGRLPLICHRGTVAPDGLAAMRDAGLAVADTRLVYDTRAQYRDHVLSLTGKALKAVTVYWTPPEVAPPRTTWIDPAVQQYLNNKGNLAELVPEQAVPQRKLTASGAEVTAALHSMPLPTVLKVATDLPNGGGQDVMICRRPRHRARANRRFGNGDTLIFEEVLNIAENHCVQYAILPETTVAYVGASSQLCLPNGVHAGNLIDPDLAPSRQVIALGREIALRGAALGFRGIAGFDIVVTDDGRPMAIDLNFRLVSSTAQVLLHPRLSRERGLIVSRLAFCTFDGSLGELLRTCRLHIHAGWLVPLAMFDPVYGHAGRGPARGRFLIFGESQEAAAAREAVLEASGIQIAGRRQTVVGRTGALVKRLVVRLSRGWTP
jgi:hypothetical protein